MKPSIPKGTRDFSPDEMVRRNYIFDTIRNIFKKYGYLPLETPAMENLETLMGKYGEEGDRLIFKIFPRGEKINKLLNDVRSLQEGGGLLSIATDSDNIPRQASPAEKDKIFNESVSQALSKNMEEALRYDLTVPFARYVVMHQNEIAFPFKRYQIQPVWRADRPQKGRYREFYQCDADVIGSDSLINEVELVMLMDEVFSSLKIPVRIKINNRKLLSGIAEVIGEKDKIVDITVAIDKLDKIGLEEVNKELMQKGVSEKAVRQLQPLINLKGDYEAKITALKSFLKKSQTGEKGIEEIEYLFSILKSNYKLQTSAQSLSRGTNYELEITLARGLNYYTGAIFEVKAGAGSLSSSICGGGRYDDLTGIFGLPGMSGVGISFGADRIYDVMTELNLFPSSVTATTKLMFAHFGEAEQRYCLPLLMKVRAAGISAELYPDIVKIKKQFDYANKKNIPFVVVVGSEEMQSGQLAFKNMSTGEQEKLSIEEIIMRLS